MELIDKHGNEINKDDFEQEEPEQEQEPQNEETEEEQGEPEFKPLVEDFNKKIKKMSKTIFERANMLDVEIQQQQAMQIVNMVHEASINALFKKLWEEGFDSVDEIIDDETENIIENMIDFEKNVETYSEADLEKINELNKDKLDQ